MKLIFLFNLLFLSYGLFAQQQKGFSITHTDSSQPRGAAYALVVGISDYKYVRPLQYATEDAFLFYQFLKSKSGGSIPEQNIKLFTDEEATSWNIMMNGISWLQRTANAGDRIILYFSGHGDAVNAQEAYFLACDAGAGDDKNLYAVGGTINISTLKNRIHDFTAKGIDVELIIDACRTDDVPGGRQGINDYNSVIENKVGELLYLSCSSNEVSYEDKRWGNGHGAFTWYLVNGLSGLADADHDGKVSSYELKSYVEDHVMNDTRVLGDVQTPYYCCNQFNNRFVSDDDKDFQSRIKQSEIEGTDQFSQQLLAVRSANSNIQFPDSALRSQFFVIRKLCRQKRFLGSNSADSIYNLLTKKYSEKELQPVKDYYVGALLDEAQAAVNVMLTTNDRGVTSKDYYTDHVRIMERAILLAGDSMQNNLILLQARLNYLRAQTYLAKTFPLSFDESGAFEFFFRNDTLIKDHNLSNAQNAETLLRQSLNSRFSFAPTYLLLARRYFILYIQREMTGQGTREQNLAFGDSVAKYTKLAIDEAPKWNLAYTYLSILPFQEGKKRIDYLLKLDSNNVQYNATAAKFFQGSGFKNNDTSWQHLNPATQVTFERQRKQSSLYYWRKSFYLAPHISSLSALLHLNKDSAFSCDSIEYWCDYFLKYGKIETPDESYFDFITLAKCFLPGGNLNTLESMCKRGMEIGDTVSAIPVWYVLEKNYRKNIVAADSLFQAGLYCRRWSDESYSYRADPVDFMEDVSDVYRALGDLKREEEILKACTERYPENKWAFFTLSRFYSRNKKEILALQNLQYALEKGFEHFGYIQLQY